MSLLRLSGLRHLLRHPWQLGLSVLGVALGVAIVVSIDLANQSAQRAFELSTEAVSGRATHQIVGGPTGLPESLYRTIRVDLGIRASAPVVEGDVVAPAHPGRVFHLLGVDPFAEEPFRNYLGPIGSGVDRSMLLTRPATVLLSAPTAAELGLGPGDTLALRVGTALKPTTIAGVLEPEDEVSRRALDNFIIADIATAQELLGSLGRLDRIDLIVSDGARGAAVLDRLAAALPPAAEIVRASTRSAVVGEMTRAFRLNLTALSLLALIFGMFLIYNTMTFSVVQRRQWIGVLRALGVTRREVVAQVLGEAFWIGVVGTAIGLGAGVVLGRGLVGLVTRTINDLYFVLGVKELALSPLALGKGVVLGVGATLLAGLAPALEATMTPPRATLSRSTLEARLRYAVPRAAAVGLGLGLIGTVLVLAPGTSLIRSFVGLFVAIIGVSLLVPLGTLALVRLLRPRVARLLGLQGAMAARGVVASLSRTAPAVAALSIAVSVTVGLGIMIGSFRQTVVRWLDQTLQADVYVSAPSLISSQTEAVLEPGLVRRIAALPGVVGMNTYRNVIIESGGTQVRLNAVELDPRGRAAFAFKEGDPNAVWPAFEEGGAVIISEPFAYRHGLGTESRVRLRTDRGEVEFPVAGVYYDYGSDQGVVMMSRKTFDQFWDDPAVSSLGLFAAPDVDRDAMVARVRGLAAPGSELVVRSNQALRQASIEVFDRTFAITAVLRLLVFMVAFIGVLSALMAVQLERIRETGVLRATGFTPGQLWTLITTQTGLMGLVSGLLALPIGLALAAVMVFVINRRSFGWTLQMEIAPEVLIQAVGLAVVAAILAGLYPAHRMSRIPPAVALREE